MKRLAKETLFESDNLGSNLSQKSIRGGVATLASQGVLFVLTLAGTMILSRILKPDDYGLFGMVFGVIGFAELFKEAGLSMATVQKDHINHEQISTLFWLNLLITVIISSSVLISSPFVAWFYGRTELTAITAVLSASFIISGLTIQHQALLRRHMQFGALSIIQISSQIISLSVTFTLAKLDWQYWALIYGSIAGALSTTLITLFFCPWLPGWIKKGTGIRSMLKFGAQITGFDFVNYFARNLDNILIGKFIGSDALAYYSKAYQMFMMPISQVRGPILNVAAPVLCTLKNEPDRYATYYQRIIDIMATLAIPLSVFFIIEADFIILLLLGKQWEGSVPVFRILAFLGMIQPTAGTVGIVMISHGYAARQLRLGIFNSIMYIAAFIIGLPYGIAGVALGYSIAFYLILIPMLMLSFRNTPITLTLFFKAHLYPLILSLLAAGLAYYTKSQLGDNSIRAHIVFIVVFGLTYLGMSLCRKSVRHSLSMISSNFKTRLSA